MKHLNILKEGKAERNADGKIIKAASYQSRDLPNARVEPNRKWFSNSRVISQESLSAFRDAIAQKEKDPYTVLLKSNKLPLSLIRDGQDNRVNGLKQHQAKMTVETSPFAEVFGPRSSRKRVKLSVSNIDELADDSVKSLETYKEKLEEARLLSGEAGAAQAEAGEAGDMHQGDEATVTTAVEPIFSKGQSKRIWNELCMFLPFRLRSVTWANNIDYRQGYRLVRCHSTYFRRSRSPGNAMPIRGEVSQGGGTTQASCVHLEQVRLGPYESCCKFAPHPFQHCLVPQDLSQGIFRRLCTSDGIWLLCPGENDFQSWNPWLRLGRIDGLRFG